MLILRYDKTFLGANSYIVADEAHGKALVVDTGAGSAPWINDTLARNGLELAAVLLTHGHPDHVWDVAKVASQVPVYIPQPDVYRLDDPLSYLPPDAGRDLALSRMGGAWVRPDVEPLPAAMLTGSAEIVPGVWLRALPAPGHTEGSTVFLTEGTVADRPESALPASDRTELIMFSGDVLFNNGVGRTDLPGGDEQKMASSLRLLVNSIKPETRVLPGHGQATTMFHETRHSPYLHAAMS